MKDLVPPLFPLDCPLLDWTIEGFIAVGDDATAWWRRLRALHPATGYWPLLLEPQLWEGSFGESSKYLSPADSLAEAGRLDGRRVLAGRQQWDGRAAGDGADVLAVQADRAWPRDPWAYRIQITHDPRGAPAEVTVALVPVDEPWQVPAVLNYGGWNDLMRPPTTRRSCATGTNATAPCCSGSGIPTPRWSSTGRRAPATKRSNSPTSNPSTIPTGPP